MPYKRKAHVLFAGSGDVCRALLATGFANSMGAEWIEARAATLQLEAIPPTVSCALAGVEFADQTLHPLDKKNIEWADLIVMLDEAADLACPPLPAKVQKRCYSFSVPENPAGWGRVRDAIQQRVAGMIGGMRMMSRCE